MAGAVGSHTMESSSFASKPPPPPPAPVLWYRGLPTFSWGSAFIGSSLTNYQLLEILLHVASWANHHFLQRCFHLFFYHKSNRNFPASEAMKRIFKMLLMPPNLYFPSLINIVYKLLATPVHLFINIEEPFAVVSTTRCQWFRAIHITVTLPFLSKLCVMDVLPDQQIKSDLSFLNIWIHPAYPYIICWEAMWFSNFLPLQKSLLSVIEHFLIYY